MLLFCKFLEPNAVVWKCKRIAVWVLSSATDREEPGYTGLSKKMDGIWNRYNLKSTGRIYTFGVLKCSEEFKVLDLP